MENSKLFLDMLHDKKNRILHLGVQKAAGLDMYENAV